MRLHLTLLAAVLGFSGAQVAAAPALIGIPLATPITWTVPYQDWRDATGACVAGKICWSGMTKDVRRATLSLMEASTQVFEVNSDGSLTYLGASASGGKGTYRVVQYIMMYTTQPCVAGDWQKGIDRIGVGVRVTADISTKKSGLNLAGIFPIGIAASSSKVEGQIKIESWGISSANGVFKSYLGFAGKIEDPQAVAKAIESLAVGNAIMQDEGTDFSPYILAEQEAKPGSCSTK